MSVCTGLLCRKPKVQVTLSIALELGAVLLMLAEVHKGVVKEAEQTQGRLQAYQNALVEQDLKTSTLTTHFTRAVSAKQ